MILLKTVLFSVFVPGTVIGLIPYLLLTRGPALQPPAIAAGSMRFIGIVPLICGFLFYLVSAWHFVQQGKGTPAPIDPPKLFVSSGPYQFVRNPMYVSGLLILLGESILFSSMILLIYLCFIWLVFHLFIVFYEEPHLRRIFGVQYKEYCKQVSRWAPALKRVEHKILR